MAQFRLVGRVAWSGFEGTRQEAEDYFAALVHDLTQNGAWSMGGATAGSLQDYLVLETAMPPLAGTARQVTYAEGVRRAMVEALDALIGYCERILALPAGTSISEVDPPDFADCTMIGNAPFPHVDDEQEFAAWIWCANAVKAEIAGFNYAGHLLDYLLPHCGPYGPEPARLIRHRATAHGLRPRGHDLDRRPQRKKRSKIEPVP